MRTLALGVMLALFLAFGGSAAAQDKGKAPVDPKEQFEKKYAQYRTKCADEIFALGNFLHGKKQFLSSKGEFEQALIWDTNHDKSRQKLGFKKQGAAWVKDSSAKPLTTDDAVGDPDGRAIDKWKNDRQKTEKKLADEAYRLGKWCSDQKEPDLAKRMYREAIDWNNGHEDARKALGHKKEGIKWVSQDEDKGRKERAAKQAAAEDGKPTEEATQEESGMGTKFAKRRSSHFIINAYFSQELTAKMVKAGETVFKEFHEMFELDINSPIQTDIHVLFLKDKKEFDNYCDRISGMSPEESESWKRLYGRHKRPDIPRIVSHHDGGQVDFPQDFVIHDTFHLLFGTRYPALQGTMKGWLTECPAYWFSAKLNGSADCVCVGGESFAAGASRGLGSDPHYWGQTVKDMVLQHKDPDMRTALICGMNSLTGEIIAKGWSAWDWMVKEKKAELFKFLDLLSSGMDQDEALKEAFGFDYAEFDRIWAEWVRANY